MKLNATLSQRARPMQLRLRSRFIFFAMQAAFILTLSPRAGWTIVPEYTVHDGAVRIQGVVPDNPLIYDNDWWFDVFDNNYLWAQASLGRVNLRGNIVSRDMWEWDVGYKYPMQRCLDDAAKALDYARRSGLRNIPGLTRGADRVLTAPPSGRIEDTTPQSSPGARLIIDEARKASPEKPLVLVTGGPLTTVASALLLAPEIAPRMIVFNILVSHYGYNGKDGWSAYIVAKKTRYVDWGGGQFWEKNSVFTARDFEPLPHNPFCDDMRRLIGSDLGQANQLGDGAPLVWLFNPRCWTGAKVHKAVWRGKAVEFSAGAQGDLLVIPRQSTDLIQCRKEFFRVLCDPAVYQGGHTPAAATGSEKPRVVALTDISNEPDDEESLVRFLVYANEYDVEGLVATTSVWLKDKTREDLIRRQVAAYGQVRGNLLRHAPGFPAPEELLAVTCTGQPGFGMKAVGEGKSTPGSRRLLAAADKDDPRPLWVSVWGGANTLAQALFDARRERSPEEFKKLVAKLRVYTISDQDDAGPWLRREFPELFYIVSVNRRNPNRYNHTTWSGISGDRFYKNGPMHKFHLVDNPWLEANIIKSHGPLGALYPRLSYIMEGDTPSFLGLVNNGLGWSVSPAYGGWGGRYALHRPEDEARPFWTNSPASRDTVTADNGQTTTSDPGTVWRWREHFQHDFAARMDWCVTESYEKANHNPVAVLNGDRTKRVIELKAKAGETVCLSAAGSGDPDGDALTRTWLVYPEAGTFRGEVKLNDPADETVNFTVPAVLKPETIHVILQFQDNGTPGLFAYRRTVIEVQP